MPTGYQIKQQDVLHYVRLQMVYWVDIFTRRIYRDVIIESLRYCQQSKTYLLLFLGYVFIYSCTSTEKYKQDLLSDDKTKIDIACYELGEMKDTSSVKLLLTKILDPRISTDYRFKGMSVNYCRLIALKKISGVDIGRKIDQFSPDTAATYFYLDWAITHGYLKRKSEVDIFYSK